MSRQVKTRIDRSVNPSEQGITASSFQASSVTDESYTQREKEWVKQQQIHDLPELRRLTTSSDIVSSLSSQKSASGLLVVGHRTNPVPLSMTMFTPTTCGSKSTGWNETWTQLQQKQLESALNLLPKGTPDRWDRIAELVPDKSKVFV